MVTEIYDGVPVQVPRQGSASYPEHVQRVIKGLVAKMREREPLVTIHSIRITRVVRQDDPKNMTIYYDCTLSRP